MKEHGHGLLTPPDNIGLATPNMPGPFPGWSDDPAEYNLLTMGLGGTFTGYQQGSFNAEFLDAAGGLMIQNLFDNSEERPGSNWMPG